MGNLDNRRINLLVGILIFMMIAFHLVNNSIYLKQSATPPYFDEVGFVRGAVEYYDCFKQHRFTELPVELFKIVPSKNRPGYPFSAALLLLIFGIQDPFYWVRWVNIIYLAILLVSLYGIGKILYDWRTGLLSAFLATIAFPLIHWFSRMGLTDVPLAAMVGATLYALLLTDNLRKKWRSFVFGLLLGISELVKISAVVFLIGPLAMLFFNVFFLRKKQPFPWPGFLLFFCGAVLLPVLYLIPQYQEVFAYITLPSLYGTEFGLLNSKYSWESFKYYFTYAIYDYNGYFFTLLFCGGFLLAIFKSWRRNLMALSWFVVPYLILCFVLGNKNPRFFIPLYPAVALLSAHWIFKINNRWMRRILTGFTVALGMGFYFSNTWGLGPLNQDHYAWEVPVIKEKILLTPHVRPPDRKKIAVKEIVDFIINDYASQKPSAFGAGKKPIIRILSNIFVFNFHYGLEYVTRLTDIKEIASLKTRIISGWSANQTDSQNPHGFFWFSTANYLRADYILLKSGDYLLGAELVHYPPAIDFAQAFQAIFTESLNEPFGSFKLLKEFPVAYDNSQIYLYRRVTPPNIDEILYITKQAIKSDPRDKYYHLRAAQSFIAANLMEQPGLPAELRQKIEPFLEVKDAAHYWLGGEDGQTPVLKATKDSLSLLNIKV
ncbi:MAG: ArnT family glycosyltransferase, partial [Candidatus Omnitrophota bacterium]